MTVGQYFVLKRGQKAASLLPKRLFTAMFSFPVLLATLAGVASATPFFGRGLPSLATRAITIEGTNCTCKGYSFSDPGFNGGEAVVSL
jgi:hypothetical protein